MENLICKILDEDIGEKSKELIKPRVRYGARGIVLRNDGKIAIFNKANKKEYKLPGGGIDEGESPQQGFIREVLEETGCEIEIIQKLGIAEEYKTLDNFMQISHVFVGRVTKDTGNLHMTQKEIVDLLEQSLKKDRTKSQILGFTKLNLLEMTRKNMCNNDEY